MLSDTQKMFDNSRVFLKNNFINTFSFVKGRIYKKNLILRVILQSIVAFASENRNNSLLEQCEKKKSFPCSDWA